MCSACDLASLITLSCASAGADGWLCTGRAVSEVMNDNLPPADAHLRKIAIHVSAYITHVRTQLKQTIPKAIVHTLVCPPSLAILCQWRCTSERQAARLFHSWQS